MARAPKQDAEGMPDHNYDVTSSSGYEFETRVKARNSNGWGGTQTQLPKGHLARRDTIPAVKSAKVMPD